jgi:hypothetical protein
MKMRASAGTFPRLRAVTSGIIGLLALVSLSAVVAALRLPEVQ